MFTVAIHRLFAILNSWEQVGPLDTRRDVDRNLQAMPLKLSFRDTYSPKDGRPAQGSFLWIPKISDRYGRAH